MKQICRLSRMQKSLYLLIIAALFKHKNKWIMQVFAATLRSPVDLLSMAARRLRARRGQFKARKGGATGHASKANATFDRVEYNGRGSFRQLLENHADRGHNFQLIESKHL